MVSSVNHPPLKGLLKRVIVNRTSEADGIRYEQKKEISSMLTGKTKRYSGVMNVIIKRLFPVSADASDR